MHHDNPSHSPATACTNSCTLRPLVECYEHNWTTYKKLNQARQLRLLKQPKQFYADDMYKIRYDTIRYDTDTTEKLCWLKGSQKYWYGGCMNLHSGNNANVNHMLMPCSCTRTLQNENNMATTWTIPTSWTTHWHEAFILWQWQDKQNSSLVQSTCNRISAQQIPTCKHTIHYH
jgi:hypothetical protein